MNNRRFLMKSLVGLAWSVPGLVALLAGAPAGAEPATQPATQPAELLPWYSAMPDAIDQARRDGHPILVDVGAAWCSWCRELDKQIATPQVQAGLARWTRLRLDADRDTDAARGLSVGPIPALRLLTPEGRVVASQDGYLAAPELLAWLDEHYKQAAPAAAEAVGAAPESAADVDVLIPKLTDPDVMVREAATRRLLARPDLAGIKVVDVFVSGKLSTRLSTLELLTEWKAPVGGIDPWDPPTITQERVGALKQWATAQTPTTMPAAAPAELAGDRLDEARRDLAAMLLATDESDLLAARERLARLGTPLLPEVYAALKSAATDRDRERLTALRYRLVASETLALNWMGGLERLASSDPSVRHAALDELGTKVTPQDAPLLSELFSDPDPLIREESLRLLQASGDASAASGLARLLHDPQPNVRAAVLKQLAETPMPDMEKEVVQFIAGEKDADLLVHAIRVLRETKTRTSAGCLMSLLTHPSWRVRAEAAEALGKGLDRYSSDQESMSRKADVYAAMIKLLEDGDGYVVGRAVLVLRDSDLEAALEPMFDAAVKRPELTGDVVRAMVGQARTHPSAVRFLRKFCANADPGIRAAAIAGLCQAAPGDAREQLEAALKDKEPAVRIAAAGGLIEVLESMRPNPDEPAPAMFGFGSRKRDMEKWLEGFRSGPGHPDWLTGLIPSLEALLGSGQPGRLVAAVPLAAMGRDEKALPALHAAVDGPPGERQRVIEALPWLPLSERISLFNELAPKAGRAEVFRLTEQMVVIPDLDAAGPIWGLAGNPSADVTAASAVVSALSNLYIRNRNYVNGQLQTDPARMKSLVEASKEKAASGSEMQRLVALALLVNAPADASEAASKVLEDKGASDALRRDALQVLLLSKPEAEGEPLAVSCLAGKFGGNWEQKKLAARYLAMGTQGLNQLRESIYLSVTFSSRYQDFSTNQPVDLRAPAGLTVEMVKPMIADTDKPAGASACYLLALLGDRSGLDTLVAYWRQDPNRNDESRVLVYRAVAALNDDSLVPILDDVYKNISQNGAYYARPFYWTIRSMKGPNILKLRKKIRDEVGMNNLQ